MDSIVCLTTELNICILHFIYDDTYPVLFTK